MPRPPERSAGIVLLKPLPEGPRLLLLRAYRNWDFPKGRIEPGESPLAAAIRESAEETGITRLEFPFGEPFTETAPYARGKVARYYLAQTDEQITRLPVSPELGRPEHHEFRWVSFEEARALLPPRLQPVLDWAAAYCA